MDLAGKLARPAPQDPDSSLATTRAANLRALLTPSSFWSPLYLQESAWLDHGAFAFWLIEAHQPRTFVELGTHGGYSYFAMCQAVKAFNLPTQCYAVDTWQGDEHAGFYGEDIYRRVHDHNERHYASFSRLVRSTFEEALSHFPDGSIDLLHIDGRHFYDDVKYDFESYRPKLSDRAVVIFHDINVRERNFGVFKLWEELRTQYPSFDFLHGHGLGVLGYGTNLPADIVALLDAAKNPQALTDIRQAYGRLGAAFKAQFEADQTRADLSKKLQEQLARAQGLETEIADLLNRAEHQSRELKAALKAQENRAEALQAHTEALNTQIIGLTEELTVQTRAQEMRAEAILAQLAARDATIAQISNSFSWRVTKPLRFASRTAQKILRRARAPLRRMAAVLYRYTPLPVWVKTRIVSLIFRLGAPVLRNTGIYQTWLAAREKAARTGLAPGEGLHPRDIPPEVARDIEIDYAAAVPFGYMTSQVDAPRLAVLCHLYHENLAQEFRRYLKNIPFPFDLFVTTDNQSKADIITRAFADAPYGKVSVKVTPNRGRDIAPKLLGFPQVYRDYDYVLHLHSKISDHAGALANWRGSLLETLLGSPDTVTSVFDAFARHSDLGMIAPQHFEAVRHWINWGGNFKAADKLARRMGDTSMSMNKVLDFPSGSMFWARTAALKPLCDLGLSFDDFEEEKGQIDATLAHSIERLYFHVCESAGFGWMKIAHPPLYRQTPCITAIDTPATLATFLKDRGLKLTGGNLPPQRKVFPTPVLASPALVNRLQSRALGTELDVDPRQKVAIGIVTYNNYPAQLRRVVESARRALERAGLRAQARILVIDNGNPSEPLVRGTPADSEILEYVPSRGNVGFGAAHNRMMEKWFGQGGDIYIATNPDGVFHPDAVTALVQMMQAHENRALIEAIQFPDEHPKTYDPFTFETPWASGACLAIPRALYAQAKGFDETFFMYCEDVDLSWRAKALGFAVRICPRALFLHQVTNRDTDPRVLKMIYGSGILLARKWGAQAFAEKMVGPLEDLGGTAPTAVPAPVPETWQRLADFKHHFTFAEMRW